MRKAGGDCFAFEADVTREAAMAAMVAEAKKRWGRIDILHYNVGVSLGGGDASPLEITEQAFDNIVAINLRGAVMACKHAVPVMREQKSGVILMISSLAAIEKYPYVTYKATKAAMIAFTEQLAIQNAEFGVRANVILPGLMDTPMAVDTRARASGKSRAEVAAMRDARVPLRRKMGTAWDVANAALFLASEEANFITGVSLLVDGGGALDIGHSIPLQAWAMRSSAKASRSTTVFSSDCDSCSWQLTLSFLIAPGRNSAISASVIVSTVACRAIAPALHVGHLAEVRAGAQHVQQPSLLHHLHLAAGEEQQLRAGVAFAHEDRLRGKARPLAGVHQLPDFRVAQPLQRLERRAARRTFRGPRFPARRC